LSEDWGKEGPRVVWKKDMGEGYSGPVLADGKVVQCHRIGGELIVQCFDAATGNEVWRFARATKFQDGAYFDSGPRPTPTIRDGKVFLHGTDGFVAALDFKTGHEVWSLHTKERFGLSGNWHGNVCSPLVTDNAVILNVGSTNDAGIVAFDRESGRVLWQATRDKPSCASPMIARLGGQPQLLVITRSALRALDPASGKEYWHWRTRKQSSGDVYAASPVVLGDQVLLSGWYKLGMTLLNVSDGAAASVWESDDAISAHYALPIVHGGFVYGYHGHGWERGGPTLRCVDLATGKLKWEQEKAGSGTIIRTGDNLLILAETGELLLGKASPDGFKATAHAQILGRTVRSYPAVADGFVYVKGPRQLVCIDLRKK
jgi:outer membrane protein assembly factor BamB